MDKRSGASESGGVFDGIKALRGIHRDLGNAGRSGGICACGGCADGGEWEREGHEGREDEDEAYEFLDGVFHFLFSFLLC